MGRVELLEPLLEDGIRNTNFFNGRLLSAEDLQQEQQASRAQRTQLAKAVGAGTVSGLRVRRAVVASPPGAATSALVTVSAGLALNRSGQTLELRADTEVALARALDEVSAEAGLFAPCEPPQTLTIATGAGVYLLALTPASGFAGRALSSGIVGGMNGSGCGSRYAVEGVQFKLISVNANALGGLDAGVKAELNDLLTKSAEADVSRLRNLLAHLCAGGGRDAAFVRQPFEAQQNSVSETSQDLLEALTAEAQLTNCDVPLALIYWTTNGIRFVDEWAVRRNVTPSLAAVGWQTFLSAQRRSAAEARFLQFQAHLEELRMSVPNPQLLVARDYFRYLPPVAFVPLASASSGGFGDALFQTQVCRRQVFIEGAKAGALVEDSLSYPPIDLSSQEMISLYFVRENMRAYDLGGSARPQPYMIVANGHIPYQGDAHYDLSRWNYSNYS